MIEIIEPLIARILGAWIAGLASFLLVHFGVVVDATAQQAFVGHLVGVVIPIFVTLSAVVHAVIAHRQAKAKK